MKKSAEYRAALRRLREQLGATFLVRIPEYAPASKVERIKARHMVKDDRHHWFGPLLNPVDVMFVIDWPYGPENNRWRAVTAKLLRQAIVHAGLVVGDCGFVSLATRDQQHPSDRPEVSRARVLNIIDAADTRHVVFVGAHALAFWHPDVTLDQAVGRVGVFDRWLVTAIHHPNAVLRDLVHQRDWMAELVRYTNKIASDDMLDWTCTRCGAAVSVFDQYGMGWCDKHLDTVRRNTERRAPKLEDDPRLWED